MAHQAHFTVRETAELSGVAPGTIEKAIQSKIVPTFPATLHNNSKPTRHLPRGAVVFFHALKAARLTRLPVTHKKRIWQRLAGMDWPRLENIEFAAYTVLHLEDVPAELVTAIDRYLRDREAFIHSDPDILGGTPVIRGTRITVYSVLGRLDGGETIDDLVEDYPGIDPRAFETAELYARSHPLRGRPAGRPWKTAS